jgi:2-(1,2-epoxy-1,2-dihydrophenyl)acetyl-CoA isomerase
VLCPAMTAALHEATENAERDARARCVILRGAGECFTGGGDIPAYADVIERDVDEHRTNFARQVADLHLIVARLRTMPKPVLASVHSAAFGFGLSLVAASDLAIAADNTMFLLPHRHIALPPDAGLSYFLQSTPKSD